MSAIAGSDYGDDRSSRHRSRTTKHKSSRSKHRRREESVDGSDTPVEVIQEENQYYDPATGTRTREVTKTEYIRSSSRRRRSRRDRSEDEDENDGVGTVAEAEAAESVATSRSRKHRSRRDKDRSERGSEYSPPNQVEYPGSRVGSVVAPAAVVAASRDRESGYSSRSPSPVQSARSSRRERRKSMGEAALGAVGLGAVAERYRDGKEGRSRSSSPAESTRSSRRAPSSKRERRKSVGETALAALGLGAAADAYKNEKRSKSRRRERPSVYSESESEEEYERPYERRGRVDKSKENSAQAAILAAAVEAFRARKEPGGATGTKGLKRIIEAAVGAGAIELFLGRNGRDGNRPSTKHIMESVIGGLGIQRVANGPRADSGHNSVKDLAASAVIALAGNTLLDKLRARSQSPEDRRRSSRSSRSSRPGMGNRKRSQSVGNLLTAGGLGTAAYEFGKNRRDREAGSDDEDNESNISPSDAGSRKSRRSRKDRGVEYDPEVNPVPISQRFRRDYDVVGYTPDGQLALAETTTELAPPPGSRGMTDRGLVPWAKDSSDDDIPDSDDEHKKMKEVRRRQWLGVALAVVGSLDLISRLYETKEKRAKAKEDVASGKISKEQAEKSDVKGRLKNLVVFGLLILGVKEAFDGWKEVMEKRKEYREVCEEYNQHHKKRQARRERGGPVVHQYIMPPPGTPGALATIPPAGTYPGYNTTYESVEGGEAYIPPQQYMSSAQQERDLRYSGYTTRDGRPLPVVYPDDVIHA